MNQNKIIIASDHTGFKLRASISKYIAALGLEVLDVGILPDSQEDYIDISKQFITMVQSHKCMGIIICKSGLGVSIASNRSNHIRAALCREPNDVTFARRQNDANVLCLGSSVGTMENALQCVKAFLETPFADHHQNCVKKLESVIHNHAANGVNLIVRGVVEHEEHVLLSTPSGSNLEYSSSLFFLPGGHVDYTESAEVALRRELLEEMNLRVDEISLLGVLECTWDKKGKVYHEINLVFRASSADLSLDCPPQSTDAALRFVWAPLANIEEYKILPEKLIPMLKKLSQKTSSQPPILPSFYSDMLENTASLGL